MPLPAFGEYYSFISWAFIVSLKTYTKMNFYLKILKHYETKISSYNHLKMHLFKVTN
jgi:hypothetical protein